MSEPQFREITPQMADEWRPLILAELSPTFGILFPKLVGKTLLKREAYMQPPVGSLGEALLAMEAEGEILLRMSEQGLLIHPAN